MDTLLPVEVWVTHIIPYLTNNDAFRLKETNRYFESLVNACYIIWFRIRKDLIYECGQDDIYPRAIILSAKEYTMHFVSLYKFRNKVLGNRYLSLSFKKHTRKINSAEFNERKAIITKNIAENKQFIRILVCDFINEAKRLSDLYPFLQEEIKELIKYLPLGG